MVEEEILPSGFLLLSMSNPKGGGTNGFRLNSSRGANILLGLMDANEVFYYSSTEGFLSVYKSCCFMTQLPPGNVLQERHKISNH